MSTPSKIPELPDTRYSLEYTSPDPSEDRHCLIQRELRPSRRLSPYLAPDLSFYELGFSSGKVRVIGRDHISTPLKDALQLGTFGTIEEAWAAILLHNSTRT